ncbi:MAG: TonB-dependent receptor, partial [candidate division Zixibacteria bacterium]|nr:TonB-dependent receptor [candidate division Zixibacteria bacterium]
GQDVVVTASRAVRGQSPVAFDNVSHEQIGRAHYAQDLPMLLTESPGVYAYSDNGNGIGYSYLSIRGFPQRRVSVLINGVPLNDPESHEVYWIDLPDLPENLQDAQIQRGVGTTLYGSNSIGGTINLLTHDVSPQPEVSVTSGFGSYDTRKFSLGLNSGLIDGRYTLYGRFARIVSDGYRRGAWTDLWSYFFSAGRYDARWTNRLNVFGGPEQTHLAYEGIPRWYINGDTSYFDTSAAAQAFTTRRPSGNQNRDRRYNPFEWPGETDNFNQPQYQLLSEFRPDSNWLFENTLYYIKGKGFYDQLRSSQDYAEYQMAPVVDGADTLTSAQGLWRRLWVENNFWGIVPRVTRRHAHGATTIGAEFNRLAAGHWAEVQSVNPAPPDFIPGQRYEDHKGAKSVASLFAQEVVDPLRNVTVTGAVQYQFKRYELKDSRFPNINGQRVAHTTDYSFVSPRLGITVHPAPPLTVFGSVSYNRQEPTNDEVFDPTDYYADAGDFFRDTVRLADGTLRGSHPVMKPERLIDYELGGDLSGPRWRLTANLFHMRFHDEIVYNGQINNITGVPLRANAPSSIHQGIELSGMANFGGGLSASANLSLNDNTFHEFTEYVPDENYIGHPVDRSGNTIAGFPKYLANVRLSYDQRVFNLSGHLFSAGREYIDNSNAPETAIQPYTVLDVRGGIKLDRLFRWRGTSFFVQVNNVFDKKYETGGYIDAGFPLFIPAAQRNYFAGLKAAF